MTFYEFWRSIHEAIEELIGIVDMEEFVEETDLKNEKV